MTIPGQPVWHLGLLRVEEDIIPHGARSNFGKNMPKPSQNRNFPGELWDSLNFASKCKIIDMRAVKAIKVGEEVTSFNLENGNFKCKCDICLQPDNDQIKKLRDEWNQVEEKSNYYAMMKLKEQADGGLARHKRLCFPVMVPLVPGPVPSQLPIIRADTLTLS